MNNIKMLNYYKIDVSKGIDINKASKSKECEISYYWYFWNKGFKFQTYVCNRCHDLLMIPINFNDIVFLNIKDSDYRSIIWNYQKRSYKVIGKYLFDWK